MDSLTAGMSMEGKHWHRHVGNLIISIIVFMTLAWSLCHLPLCLSLSQVSPYFFSLKMSVSMSVTFLTSHDHYTVTCFVAYRLFSLVSPPSIHCASSRCVFHKQMIGFPSFSCACRYHDSDLTATAEAANMTVFPATISIYLAL